MVEVNVYYKTNGLHRLKKEYDYMDECLHWLENLTLRVFQDYCFVITRNDRDIPYTRLLG